MVAYLIVPVVFTRINIVGDMVVKLGTAIKANLGESVCDRYKLLTINKSMLAQNGYDEYVGTVLCKIHETYKLFCTVQLASGVGFVRSLNTMESPYDEWLQNCVGGTGRGSIVDTTNEPDVGKDAIGNVMRIGAVKLIDAFDDSGTMYELV